MECDGCTACCKVLPIDSRLGRLKDEVEKYTIIAREGELCTYCDNGCTIHSDRPRICRTFDCVYIQDGYNKSLRPDKSGVIFEKVWTKIFLATVDRDFIDTWKTEEMLDHIQNYNKQGISVVVSSYACGLIETFCADNHPREKVLQLITQAARENAA